MAYNLPFSTSEILIGSDKNKIFISNSGDMVFVDGSLVGTQYEDGIALSNLANVDSIDTLDDLIDTTDVTADTSYLLYRKTDGSWSAVEFTPPDTTVENLDDILDVDAGSPSENDVLTFVSGVWKNTPKASSLIVEVEAADWTFNATIIDGDPGYSVTVPHNLGLTLPADLLDVSLWDTNNELITVHTVRQQTNAIYLEATSNLDMYVAMRKI